MTASLFRAQSEVVEEIDQQISDLANGGRLGPLGQHLDSAEIAVLRAIRFHRGARNAITIAELRERIQLSEREIKQIVRTLRVDFRLPIGSSKNSVGGGYFVIVSIEDQEIATAGPLAQIRAEIEVLKVVTSPERTRELLGQIQLEV